MMSADYDRSSNPSQAYLQEVEEQRIQFEVDQYSQLLPKEILNQRKGEKTENISDKSKIFFYMQELIQLKDDFRLGSEAGERIRFNNQDCSGIDNTYPTEVRVYYNIQQEEMWAKKQNQSMIQLSRKYVHCVKNQDPQFSENTFYQELLQTLEKESQSKKEYITQVKSILASILTAFVANGKTSFAERMLKVLLNQPNNFQKKELEEEIRSKLSEECMLNQVCPQILALLQRFDVPIARISPTNNLGNDQERGISKDSGFEEEEDMKFDENDQTRQKYSFEGEASKSDITSIQTEKESFKCFEDEISEIDFKIPSSESFCQGLQSEGISDSQESADEEDETKVCENLSMEIWQYNLKCTERYHKAWEDISPLFYFLCKIGHQMGMLVEVVGSFATSLWTPHSDINILFIPGCEESFHVKNLLSQIYNWIKNEKESLNYHCLFLNDKPKDYPFFNIKVEVGEEKRRVSLGIVSKKHSARTYSNYVSECVKSNPFIGPIFFTFHKLLENFQLHKPNKRGLKNYAIFLMIMKSFEVYPSDNLAQSFSNFIYFFAEVYEFQEEVVEEKGLFVEKEKLCLRDPLNPNITFGGSNTNISKLTHLFGAVNCALKMGYSKNVLDYLWSLNLMFQQNQSDWNELS